MKKNGIVSGVAMIVVLSITILMQSIAMAKVYFVGDENGCRPGVHYQAWSANKFFTSDDFLVFKYIAGKDHVDEVDGPSFQSCRIPASHGGTGSGFDIVSLRSGGRKWFIGDHCDQGEKIVISVFGPFAPLPLAPAPSASPRSC